MRAGRVSGIITDEKIRKLDEMGMNWEVRVHDSFETLVESYRKYKEDHPDGIMPPQYIDDQGIKVLQRRAYGKEDCDAEGCRICISSFFLSVVSELSYGKGVL